MHWITRHPHTHGDLLHRKNINYDSAEYEAASGAFSWARSDETENQIFFSICALLHKKNAKKKNENEKSVPWTCDLIFSLCCDMKRSHGSIK